MIKNHNNDLSIPYKVPHFVLSREEREPNTGGGEGRVKEGMTCIQGEKMSVIILRFLGLKPC